MTPEDLEAVGLRVKPLEWEPTWQDDMSRQVSAGFDCDWYVHDTGNGWISWAETATTMTKVFQHCDETAAKSSCDELHATRIAGELERIDHADS